MYICTCYSYMHIYIYRVDNLYFAFLIVLQSVYRARGVLSRYEFLTGNSTDDELTTSLVKSLLSLNIDPDVRKRVCSLSYLVVCLWFKHTCMYIYYVTHIYIYMCVCISCDVLSDPSSSANQLLCAAMRTQLWWNGSLSGDYLCKYISKYVYVMVCVSI
jgi:hypothetical protein